MDYVYAVSRGDYSDYRVMCVCPDKATAERVADAHNGDSDSYEDARVEAIRYITEPRKVTTYMVSATIYDNGDVRDGRNPNGALTESPQERVEWEFDPLYPERLTRVGWRWIRAPMHAGEAGRLEVSGLDREAVLKVFSERKAQLLADDAMRSRSEIKGR